MKVFFSPHAIKKMALLRRYGFPVTEEEVVRTLETPDRVEEGYGGRKVAQRRVSERHVLRVIFEIRNEYHEVVTLYPGRRSRYEL